ncbi:MAG: hypothetical protein SWO11_05545 [Thermodesulfobacteriota bacterium]|nr:hypothetical protein [Thermodesulfobacteriota bacterium]
MGTTFNIYLPASEKELLKGNGMPDCLLKGTETVLLIDDEDEIINVAERMLYNDRLCCSDSKKR